MIKDVISSGPFIQISGGGSFTPYVNMSNPSAGMVRWNGNSQNLEVYDGSTWQTISSSIASVGITPYASEAISWARRKMDEEANLKKLADDHPAIKIALDNLERAKQQLDATIILSKEHEETTS